MLSKLQSRIRQFAPFAAPPSQAPEAASNPRPDAMSAPRLTESRNPALRTIGGTSLFEADPAKPGQKAAKSTQEPAPAADVQEQAVTSDAQKDAVKQALAANGEPVEFVNSDGTKEEIVIERAKRSDSDSFVVHVGDDSFRVDFKDGTPANRERFLAKAIDAYSETPPAQRSALSNFVVTSEAGGKTATGSPAAASAGGGTITFYNDAEILNDSIFHHELGHLIGAQQDAKSDSVGERAGEELSGETGPVPDGWRNAALADGGFLTPYAEADFNQDKNYTEDFAEAWAEYMNVIDEGPEALAAFRQMYPERTRILEEIAPPPQMLQG
ncbi:hypothetical protein [Pyxidicoccus xibeiensis]|uniref:hypothetical protein n=1 Tax=Pyxidicoccus xibeiensis TaxID=2906759 RepID=UPI0020A72EF0|nr:hypothetical protein [Pyxidicoccus xibeiensis]MCP3138109.1 hypothetical protein [Pyxidicoccus xibeiensis]